MENRKKVLDDPILNKSIEEFDLFKFLDEHSIDYTMEGVNIGKDYVGVNPCPGCGDTGNHFAVHTEKKFGTCWKCKCYFRLDWLISFMTHLSHDQALEYIKIDYGENAEPVDIIKNIFKKTKQEVNKDPIVPIDKLPTSRLIRSNDILHSKKLDFLFRNKHLCMSDVWRYKLKIGYGKYSNSIIFPVIINGKQLTYQIRRFDFKRYTNADNLLNYLYRSDKVLKDVPLILVEGIFDYIRLNNYISKHLKGKISVTTGFVKSISKKQLFKLNRLPCSRLIVIHDADSWFNYAYIKNNVDKETDFIILPKDTDPNELKEEEINCIIRKIL